MTTERAFLRKLTSKPVIEFIYGDIINSHGDFVMDFVHPRLPSSLIQIYLSNGDKIAVPQDVEMPFYGNIIKRDMRPYDTAT